MKPLEKLKEDVTYWRQQVEEARETIKVGEPVLRQLLSLLEAAEGGPAETARKEDKRQEDVAAPAPELTGEGNSGGGTGAADRPSFTGAARDQVEQALDWRAPQSSEELMENLARYGKEFSRGAIGYAIRDLRREHKIRRAKKVGNLQYYEPVKDQGSGEKPADFIDPAAASIGAPGMTPDSDDQEKEVG